LKRFLSNIIKRKRLAAWSPSSGQIRKTMNANGKRIAFFQAGARTTDREALSLRKERTDVS
jgi:hypothetical protein